MMAEDPEQDNKVKDKNVAGINFSQNGITEINND
jgi:hypothetical protein